MYEHSKTARASVDEARRILRMPQREARAWAAMSHAERVTLVRAAGIGISAASCAWEALSDVERAGVCRAAVRARMWALSLGIARPVAAEVAA